MVRMILPLALMAVMSPAWALNMSGFKDAPITRLSGEELKAFRAAVMKVLDETPEGTTVESDARDLLQRGVYNFCKQANGEWQFKIPALRSKVK